MKTSSFHIPTPLHVVREPLLMTQICCWPTFPFKLGGVINQLVRCIYTILGSWYESTKNINGTNHTVGGMRKNFAFLRVQKLWCRSALMLI